MTAKQDQAAAVFVIARYDGIDGVVIVGARHDFIRALKIVNRLNDWTVEAAMRVQHAQAAVYGTPPWPRYLFSQPYHTETVAVR